MSWFLVKVTSIMLYEFVMQPWEQLSDYAEAYPTAFLRGFFTAEGNP
jgi:intein-encoded DNA endonuclease-like protein